MPKTAPANATGHTPMDTPRQCRLHCMSLAKVAPPHAATTLQQVSTTIEGPCCMYRTLLPYHHNTNRQTIQVVKLREPRAIASMVAQDSTRAGGSICWYLLIRTSRQHLQQQLLLGAAATSRLLLPCVQPLRVLAPSAAAAVTATTAVYSPPPNFLPAWW